MHSVALVWNRQQDSSDASMSPGALVGALGSWKFRDLVVSYRNHIYPFLSRSQLCTRLNLRSSEVFLPVVEAGLVINLWAVESLHASPATKPATQRRLTIKKVHYYHIYIRYIGYSTMNTSGIYPHTKQKSHPLVGTQPITPPLPKEPAPISLQAGVLPPISNVHSRSGDALYPFVNTTTGPPFPSCQLGPVTVTAVIADA